jgi:hypothetical protein
LLGEAPGRPVGVDGEQDDGVRADGVRAVDARGGADEPVPGLRDHERRSGSDDPRGLAEDDLDVARVMVGGELARMLGRLDLVERDDATFRLGDDLLGDDEDVSGLEPACPRSCVAEQCGQVVALPHLGDPLEGQDADPAHLKPTKRIPAWIL